MVPKFASTLLFFILFGCMPKTADTLSLEKATDVIDRDYTQAKNYLDEIVDPFDLNDKDFALYTYLSCRIADSSQTDLPLHSEIEIATKFYLKHKDNLKTTRMLLFLGRSCDFNEENYEAMVNYLKALSLAKENNYYNEIGYISSYMGDFYSKSNDLYAATAKYKEAADFFSLAGNLKSQAYAYRDLGRSWALVDSLDASLSAFEEAEKIARSIHADMALSTILNGKGNVYRFMGKFDLAEETLLKSLDLDTIGSIATINALTSLYIGQGRYDNAKHLLDSLSKTTLNEDFINTLEYKYFLLYDAQGDCNTALAYLKKVFDYDQFLLDEDSRVSFHELEKKYNNVMLVSSLDKIRIQRQLYIILSILLILFVFILIVVVQYRSKKSTRVIAEQDKEIQNLMAKYYVIKNELKNKEEIINTQYSQKEKEIQLLSEKLKDLRRKRLLDSDIGKKLKVLASSVKPQMDKPLITEKMWKAIEKEVKEVCPEFELKLSDLHHQELSKSDWLYCCLLLFNFNSNEEGVLLNINPHSARTRKTRIRRKLGIELNDEQRLNDYFIENMLSF